MHPLIIVKKDELTPKDSHIKIIDELRAMNSQVFLRDVSQPDKIYDVSNGLDETNKENFFHHAMKNSEELNFKALIRLDPPISSEIGEASSWVNKPSSVLKFQDKRHQVGLIKNFYAGITSWEEFHQYDNALFVQKPRLGKGGNNVKQISREDCLKLKKTNLFDNWILMPFYESIFDGEIRIFVVNGSVAGAVKKIPQHGNWKANAHLGAKIEEVHYPLHIIPGEIQLEFKNISQEKGLNFFSVDIVWQENTPKVIEINLCNPGLLDERTIKALAQFMLT